MAGLMQDIEMIGQTFPELQELRALARAAFVMPKPKDEAWRYTKLRELDADDYVMNNEYGRDIEADSMSKEPGFECYQIHFNNGIFSPFGSKLPEDVEVYPLIEAFLPGVCTCGGKKEEDCCEVKRYLNKNIDFKNYPFAALNTAYLQEGVLIRIEGKLDKPLAIIYHTETEQNLFYNTHHLIVLEDKAAAEIVEIFEGKGKAVRYFGNHVNEIFVGRKARLNHCKLQNEAGGASHIALSMVEVAEGGQYQHLCLQKGAVLARNEVVVKLLGREASAQINGTYAGYGQATLDTTTLIEHWAPYTYSQQLVKGVISGKAHGVFQGKIHIATEALKVESAQQHRALLLSDKAEVDVKPELDIYADDVKCSHGAAAGELDEEALFYMEARGINREDAKQILIDAYLDEVIDSIENGVIWEWFRKALS